MNVIEAIQQRRSIKHFDPEHVMSDDVKQQILNLAALSPTAFNLQHWRLVQIEDVALRQTIKELAWGQSQVTDASMLLVLCADVKAWKKNPERYWVNAPKESQERILPAIQAYYEGDEQTQRDEAMRSCGMVAQTLMLTVKSLGYDTCPMVGFDFKAVGEQINLPEDHVVSMMLAIGKGVQSAKPRSGPLPLKEVLITNRF
ncbi:MAG: nitroreductase family protein [Cycloclasticus sp.]|nr:nitroreductase family protein [Cycloclasticus sp.]